MTTIHMEYNTDNAPQVVGKKADLKEGDHEMRENLWSFVL